jgi:serine/threonine protein phosphatase PrpC
LDPVEDLLPSLMVMVCFQSSMPKLPPGIVLIFHSSLLLGGSGVSGLLKKRLYDSMCRFLLLKRWEFDDSKDGSIDFNQPPPKVVASGDVSLVEDGSMEPDGRPAGELSAQTTFQSSPLGIPDGTSIASLVAAIRCAFAEVEKEVIADDALKFQGSTAVGVVLHENHDGSRTLLSMNVGDSRAVLSRRGQAIDLTRDHKPSDEKEMARIVAMGEQIEWDSYAKVHRVRNLAVARAIGDRYAKPVVSPEVEIQRFPVQEDSDEFVILASDGLWDVVTSQEAVSLIHDRLRAESSENAGSAEYSENVKLVLRKNMSKFLAREALRRGSADNISVVVVWLNDFSIAPPKPS